MCTLYAAITRPSKTSTNRFDVYCATGTAPLQRIENGRRCRRTMFDQLSKWSVFVWNVFSVVSTDHSEWQLIYSAVLMACCAYIIYVTPQVVCALEGNCDNSFRSLLKGMFARVVAAVGLTSRLVLIVKGNGLLAGYKRTVDEFHARAPMTRAEARSLRAFSFAVVLCSVLLVVPVNALRLWLLWNVAKSTLACFALAYTTNFSMFCIETHFTVLCFVLYQKFAGINGDLIALRADTLARNKYPAVSRARHDARVPRRCPAAGQPVSDFVEKLKARHRLGRDAVDNLNNVFGVHLALSLCSLIVYAMFDLYYHILGLWNPSKSMTLVYGWIFQYFFRFATVTTVAHMTTKQVCTNLT